MFFDFLTGKQVLIILLVGAALTGLGLVFCLIYMLSFRGRFKEHALGNITGVASEMGQFFGKDVMIYHLRVRFDTKSGTHEGSEVQSVMKPDDFYVGQQVNVRYRKDKPELFFVYENDRFFYAVKVLGVLLVIELGMAALVAAIS